MRSASGLDQARPLARCLDLVEVAADARDLLGALAFNRSRRDGPHPRARHDPPERGLRRGSKGGRSHPVALGNRSGESAEPIRFFTDSKLPRRESRG